MEGGGGKKGSDRGEKAGCNNGNAWRQAFALSHHPKGVPLGTATVELTMKQALQALVQWSSRSWREEVLYKRPGVGWGGRETQVCVEDLMDVAGMSECVFSASDRKLPGPFLVTNCMMCSKAHGRAEHP